MNVPLSPESQRDWLIRNRPAVRAAVLEPVIAFHVFTSVETHRDMVLVLSQEFVRAFEFESVGDRITLGYQHGAWKRSRIEVKVHDTRFVSRLTIKSRWMKRSFEAGHTANTDTFLLRMMPAVPLAA
jgi:hypothetical protein